MPTNDQAPIRRFARAQRQRLGEAERHAASSTIGDKVNSAAWFQRATNVACYIAMPEEVDVSAVIDRAWRMKKRVFVPVTGRKPKLIFRELRADSDIRRNSFGIYEPVEGLETDPESLDVVVTPLVAFDENCNRIGMGAGYFDRTFSFLEHRRMYRRPKLVGVAFACQKVEKIVPNPWDIPLFSVVTESCIY